MKEKNVKPIPLEARLSPSLLQSTEYSAPQIEIIDIETAQNILGGSPGGPGGNVPITPWG